APLRRADRALTGATGALLAPRLRTAAGDLGAGLRAVRAGAGRGQLRGDDLVEDGLVRLDAEDLAGQVDGARGLPGRRLHGDGGGAHDAAALTALRMRTRPPAGPGTEPRRRMRLRSESPSTTSRLRVVVRTLPVWPAIRMPLNTRAGVAHAPIDPGAR